MTNHNREHDAGKEKGPEESGSDAESRAG